MPMKAKLPHGDQTLVVLPTLAFVPPEWRHHPSVVWATFHQLQLSVSGQVDLISIYKDRGVHKAILGFSPRLLRSKRLLAVQEYFKQTGIEASFFGGKEEDLFKWIESLPFRKREKRRSDMSSAPRIPGNSETPLPGFITDPVSLPHVLQVPAGQRLYILGINPLSVAGLCDDEHRFAPKTASEAVRVASNPPADMFGFVALKQVPTPQLVQLRQTAASNGSLCIAIPNWGVADLRNWLATCQIEWDYISPEAESQALPDPDQNDIVEEPTPAENATAGSDLAYKYQALVLQNANLRNRIQTLSIKVDGLLELLDEKEKQ